MSFIYNVKQTVEVIVEAETDEEAKNEARKLLDKTLSKAGHWSDITEQRIINKSISSS